MCKASIYATQFEDAKTGDNLTVSESNHGLGAFHKEGGNVSDCITCVKDGTTMTINGIPLNLQNQHGLGATAIVKFEDAGDNKQDFIVFENGAKVPLIAFAAKQGQPRVRAYVGVAEDLSASVADTFEEPPVPNREFVYAEVRPGGWASETDPGYGAHRFRV